MLTEVVACVAAGIAYAVRIQVRFGEKHEPGRFKRRSGQNDDFGLCLVSLEGARVHKSDAASLSRTPVDQDLARDGIGPEREVAGLRRRIDQSRRRVEGRMNITASGTATARAPPIAAAAIFVVLQSVGRDPRAIRGQDTPHFRDAPAQLHFGVVELDWALEQAVGQVGQILLLARDSEVQVHLVVVGCDVLVRDRPVFAVAIVRPGLEIIVRQAQREAAPDVRLAPQAAGSHPCIIGAGIGMVLLVDDDVFAVIRTGPTLDIRVDVIVRGALRIRRLADRVFVE